MHTPKPPETQQHEGASTVDHLKYADLRSGILVMNNPASAESEPAAESTSLFVIPYDASPQNLEGIYASAELAPLTVTQHIGEAQEAGTSGRVKAWDLKTLKVEPPSVGARVVFPDAQDSALVAVAQELLLAADREGITHCRVSDEGLGTVLAQKGFPLDSLVNIVLADSNSDLEAGRSSVWIDIEGLRHAAHSQVTPFFAKFNTCMRQQPFASQPRQYVILHDAEIKDEAPTGKKTGLLERLREIRTGRRNVHLGRVSTSGDTSHYTAGFYEEEGAPDGEASRLDKMAKRADPVSIRALGEYAKAGDMIIADFGAGDSTSLAYNLKLRNPHVRYWPIDTRDEAVSAHKAAGWPAQKGSALEAPYEDSSVNAAHSRFVFGWLGGKEGVTKAVQEMLRVVGRNSGETYPSLSPRLAILDYDWTVAEGPAPLEALIAEVSAWVQTSGFNPEFGAVMKKDITFALNESGLHKDSYTMDVQRDCYIRPLGDALSIIEAHISPLISMLHEKRLDTGADELKKMLGDVQQYAQMHPDEEVRLPDIVSVTIDITNDRAHRNAVRRIQTEYERQEQRHSLRTLTPIDTLTPNTVRIPADMTSQARRFHADVYRSRGYVTEDALDPEGGLITGIDPEVLVEASTYLAQVNKRGEITAQIRCIEPGANGAGFLPTVSKIDERLRAQGRTWADLDLPFDLDKDSVFEGSALAVKTGLNHNPVATVELFMAAIVNAHNKGHKYGIIGFVERPARLLARTYGNKVFQRIGDDSLNIVLGGEGISPQGITLVPFYTPSDPDVFLGALLDESARLSDAEITYIKQAQKTWAQRTKA